MITQAEIKQLLVRGKLAVMSLSIRSVKCFGLAALLLPAVAAAQTAPVAAPQKIAYKNFSYDKAFAQARKNEEMSLTLGSAFRLSQLEEAKAKAAKEGKLLGFIMVWDSFFNEPAEPMARGSGGGLVHFYDVFHDNLVLVFVRHEDELNLVPDAVKKGFQGPEEGGFAPNMAVVSADAQDFVCEIPYGGNQSNGAIREPIYRGKIDTINAWLDAQGKAK